MKSLKFKCPLCGSDLIDEVSTGVIAYNEVEVSPDGEFRYGEEELVYEGGRTSYQCRSCHMTIGGATDGSSLAEWINLNCTFSIETIREKLGVTEQQALNIRAILFDLEPLQHEGNRISTAERHLFDEQLLRDRGKSDAVRKSAFVIEAVTSVCAGELPLRWYKWMTNAALASYSATEYLLAYSLADKYYFWATIQDLHELEEQWKKNNS